MPAKQDFTNFATERPNYFPGQFLLEDDFELQHKYLGDRQTYHNQSLQVSGILEGLEVTPIQDKKEVEIAAGTAIDSAGHLLVLKNKLIFADFGSLTKGSLYLQFTQEKTNKQQEEITESFTRWTENIIVGVATKVPVEAIALCTFQTIGDDEVRVDRSISQYSGVYLPNATNQNLSLRSGGTANPNLAILNGNLKVTGNAETVGNQAIGKNLDVTGKVAIAHVSQDANGDALTLGTTLRLGHHLQYGWIQSHSNKPLAINPLGNNVGIGVTKPTHFFHVKTGDAVGLFESTGTQAYLRLASQEGMDNRVELANRQGGRLALWTAEGGDALNITRAGDVAIGTADPQGSKLRIEGNLHVQGDITTELGTGGWRKFAVTLTQEWGNGDSHVTLGAGGGGGIMLSNPHVTWRDNRASIRYAHSGGTAAGSYWDVGARTNNIYSVAFNGVSDHKLWIQGNNGNVGIGTTDPKSRLSVVAGNNGEALTLEGVAGHTSPTLTFVNPDNTKPTLITPRDGSILNIEYNGTTPFKIDGTGKVTLGNNLQVSGTGSSSVAGSLEVASEIKGQLRSKLTQFKVEGKRDEYYPIIFQDDAWSDGECILEIVRSSVHTDKQWYGSLLYKFTWHGTNYGHGSQFAHMEMRQERTYFLADYQILPQSPRIVIWLKGNTTYWFRSNAPTSLTDGEAKAKTLDGQSLAIKAEADIRPDLKVWSASLQDKPISLAATVIRNDLSVKGAVQLGHAASITNFGVKLSSGFYENAGNTKTTGDVPDTSHDWSHLITARHSNTDNNHQLQIAASYSVNDRLFFRKIAADDTSNPSWNEMATRAGNTFSEDQNFSKKLRFNSNNNRAIYGAKRGKNNSRETIVMSGHWDELEVRGRVIDWNGSNLHIGHEIDHSNDSIYIGNGKLASVEIQGTTPLKVAGRWVTTGAEKSLTMLRGLIKPDGGTYSGSGFSSRKITTGFYEITFDNAFADYPAVIATQDYPGNPSAGIDSTGNTKDNAVVTGIAPGKFRVKCGGDSGKASDRYFSFLAIGLR